MPVVNVFEQDRTIAIGANEDGGLFEGVSIRRNGSHGGPEVKFRRFGGFFLIQVSSDDIMHFAERLGDLNQPDPNLLNKYIGKIEPQDLRFKGLRLDDAWSLIREKTLANIVSEPDVAMSPGKALHAVKQYPAALPFAIA